jgi:acyl carrier protein
MTRTQEQALEVLATVSHRKASDIKPQHNLSTDLGMDSPKGLQFLLELEEKTKIVISDEDAARMTTVADILEYIDSHRLDSRAP